MIISGLGGLDNDDCIEGLSHVLGFRCQRRIQFRLWGRWDLRPQEDLKQG